MSPDRYPIFVSTDSVDSRFSRPSKPKQEAPEYVRIRKIMRDEQPHVTPRKVMGAPTPGHRADQEAFRRFQPIRAKAEAIKRKDGGSADVIAAQLAIIAKVAAKRERTDNIGREV